MKVFPEKKRLKTKQSINEEDDEEAEDEEQRNDDRSLTSNFFAVDRSVKCSHV